MHTTLALDELEGLSEDELRVHIVEMYEADLNEVNKYDILIAMENVYGYDENAFWLLRKRRTNLLYEVHAGHSPCYGYEDQFEPEETTLEYLQSDKFAYRTNHTIVKYINTLS